MGRYLDFLKGIDVFDGLGLQDLQRLDEACRPESFDRGQIVIAEGAAKDKFYLIQQGAVDILKGYATDAPSRLALLGPGEMFGELSFIDDHPRSATAVTRERSHLLAIDREAFLHLLAASPAISLAIMKWIAAMLRTFNRNFVETMQRRNQELEQINRQLAAEVEIRKEKERELSRYQNKLEERVLARTRELSAANDSLKREVAFRRRTEAEKAAAIIDLENALERIQTLSGLFPVCVKCRKIRDDSGYWQRLEEYLQAHSDVTFRESICSECSIKAFPRFYK